VTDDRQRAAFLAGYSAGSRDEWQGARDQVSGVLVGQARAGRDLLSRALELVGLPDLLTDDLGPMQDEQDAAAAWLAHVQRSATPS
jgi:hypothetical protein